MAKIRVYDLAKEFGVTCEKVIDKYEDLGLGGSMSAYSCLDSDELYELRRAFRGKPKIRIYELAAELGVENRAIIAKCKELGFGEKGPSHGIENWEADAIRLTFPPEEPIPEEEQDVKERKISFDDREMSVEERRVKSTVIRRRTKGITKKPSSEMASKADKASDFFKSFLLLRENETKGSISESANRKPSEPQDDLQSTDVKTSESYQNCRVIFVPDTNFFKWLLS